MLDACELEDEPEGGRDPRYLTDMMKIFLEGVLPR